MRGLPGCVAVVEVREMLLLAIAFSFLKNSGEKKGKKKNEIGNSIPKKTYFVVLGFFSSDGYAFCKVSEISVDCRDMQGEREALATVLRCRESELELLRGCLGNTNPDQEQRKGLLQILE